MDLRRGVGGDVFEASVGDEGRPEELNQSGSVYGGWLGRVGKMFEGAALAVFEGGIKGKICS